MNQEKLKNSIKVSEKLDESILKGIEKGRKEKPFIRKNKISTVAKVSSLLIIGTLCAGVINPDIIRAIPILGKVIEGFDSSNFGGPTDKYIKYSQGVEIVSEDKKAKVTLNDVMIDENICMLGFVIESNALKGFEGKNQHDFINIDADITLNGKSVDGIGHVARQIDDRTGAVVIKANIAELNIPDDVEVDVKISNIRGKKNIQGNWDFKLKTNKVEGSNRKDIGETYKIKNQNLTIKEIVTSPISSTIVLTGIDDIENYTLQSARFKVVDDNGRTLKSNIVSSSVYNETGEFSAKLEIFSDILNLKYVELIPYWGMDTIDKQIEGIYHELLTTTGSGERENIVISRNPTKEELKSGYASSKVYYNLNIDKDREFLSIEELKGYEIPVNNKDKVIIKDIQVNEESTKIIMTKEGDYSHLGQIVLFDEDMNDIAIWEGHIGAVLENEEEDIYSITLDKIDTSKRYKIALPLTKDIDLNSAYKIRINLD